MMGLTMSNDTHVTDVGGLVHELTDLSCRREMVNPLCSLIHGMQTKNLPTVKLLQGAWISNHLSEITTTTYTMAARFLRG